ncbi:hypothetical protein [Planctomycetes bacterium Pan216]|uniref:SGNH/GDSL hydrolase family protein n=1 Tax=Kolteria novifilia TaxID=2527975 RepID=UPI0011A8AF4B
MIGIVMLEVAIRMVSQEGESLLVKDTLVGQRYVRDTFESTYVPEAGREVMLRFNAEGFRGPDRPKTKPRGLQRVAVLGDSFIAAVAVEEEDSLVGRLEVELVTADSGAEWEVMNFGVSGFSTGQSLLTWRHFAREYDPDLVLLCFYNGNDLADNHHGSSSGHRPYFVLNEGGSLQLVPLKPVRSTLSRWLAEYSQFYVWQKHQTRKVRDLFRETANVLPPGFHIFDSEPTGETAEAWEVTERLITTVAEEVRESGAEVVVVGIPAHEQLVEKYWYRLIETVGPAAAGKYDPNYPEQRLGKLCHDQGISYLPMVNGFRELEDPASCYFLEVGHWNEKGNDVAARLVVEHLADLAAQSALPARQATNPSATDRQ